MKHSEHSFGSVWLCAEGYGRRDDPGIQKQMTEASNDTTANYPLKKGDKTINSIAFLFLQALLIVHKYYLMFTRNPIGNASIVCNLEKIYEFDKELQNVVFSMQIRFTHLHSICDQ